MINSVDELEYWFKFTVQYAQGTKDDDRRAFDTAAAKESRLFTPAFTDDALVLFDKIVEAPPPIKTAAAPVKRGR